MLKEFVEKIVELATPQTYTVNGDTYSIDRLHRIAPHVDRPETFHVSGLDSIEKLVRNEIHKLPVRQVMVRVCGPTRVEVSTTFRDDLSRDTLYIAESDVPGFRDGFRDRETALIQLRSLFAPTPDLDYLLTLLSRVSKEANVTSTDNGVTQQVEARAGIALLDTIQIKPRVSLQPFRTFLEVAQPESEFLLRLDENGRVGLWEADGGVWKLEAKRLIASWLGDALADLVEVGSVVIMI